ncbi:hypothetical protein CkaCkLH20_06235 [Colletotrichum karsti]|uniref:Uncharacterized protein n=1 Tax=Colletotrichum karsti TaxID=1095194 RepID=A0A9P6I5U7_9PEZI|nr:uncharacterized protein CkaCkLH20_06235 [Colletotrichum karsti]KAF9876292.1 hypothetical protein CkaCkLH20_06235 [Colletotrichum karsti]
MSARMAARITNTAALRVPLRRSAFSTATARRAGPAKNANNNNNKPDDIEIPAFNIKHITSSRRARFWLISLFWVFASIEGYGWYNFGPKILGWEKEKEKREE